MTLLTNKLQEKVRKILLENVDARDCDRILTALIWEDEMELNRFLKSDIKEPISINQFLAKYVNGKFTLADSITRARRKLQEEDKTLRGKNWYKRKNRAEEIRQEMIEYRYE